MILVIGRAPLEAPFGQTNHGQSDTPGSCRFLQSAGPGLPGRGARPEMERRLRRNIMDQAQGWLYLEQAPRHSSHLVSLERDCTGHRLKTGLWPRSSPLLDRRLSRDKHRSVVNDQCIPTSFGKASVRMKFDYCRPGARKHGLPNLVVAELAARQLRPL